MRLTEGDRVRHRGLQFISGIVAQVIMIPDADPEDENSYFCKVQLKNGQFYSDRASEWELNAGAVPPSSNNSKPDHDEPLYKEMG
ncbi:MAG: hypothetical protein JRH07_09975 [Deltaproteobacteria bacterium]|nr:hypothetical protein [Deltaproteobacteria bacterium]